MSEILIDHVLLDRVTKAAKESPRLRMNYNFHESLSSPSQRLLIIYIIVPHYSNI